MMTSDKSLLSSKLEVSQLSIRHQGRSPQKIGRLTRTSASNIEFGMYVFSDLRKSVQRITSRMKTYMNI